MFECEEGLVCLSVSLPCTSFSSTAVSRTSLLSRQIRACPCRSCAQHAFAFLPDPCLAPPHTTPLDPPPPTPPTPRRDDHGRPSIGGRPLSLSLPAEQRESELQAALDPREAGADNHLNDAEAATEREVGASAVRANAASACVRRAASSMSEWGCARAWGGDSGLITLITGQRAGVCCGVCASRCVVACA